MSDMNELSMTIDEMSSLSESVEASTKEGEKLTLCVSPLNPDVFGWRVGAIKKVGENHGEMVGELEKWLKKSGARISGVKNREYIEEDKDDIPTRVFVSIPTAVNKWGQDVPVPMKFFAFALRPEHLRKYYFQKYALNERHNSFDDNRIPACWLDKVQRAEHDRREKERDELYWWGLKKPPAHDPGCDCTSCAPSTREPGQSFPEDNPEDRPANKVVYYD